MVACTAWLLGVGVLGTLLNVTPVYAAAPETPEASSPLPVPPGLKRQIKFWKDIFGTYSTREVVIHVPGSSRNTLEALAELLSRHRGDRKVSLELDVKAHGGSGLRVRADVAQRVRPSEKLVEEVEQLCGSGSVQLR